jgi:hypothetical protein
MVVITRFEYGRKQQDRDEVKGDRDRDREREEVQSYPGDSVRPWR